MDYVKIENVFTDFIIDLVGPNPERDNIRNLKFAMIKPIMEKALCYEFKDFIPHIFTYGSFSIKTYLKDADIDITILFEDKNTHKLINPSIEIINNTIMIIKKAFEDYNYEIKNESFTEINIIFAEIRLLKCKFDSFSVDISVNNLSGLVKIFYINYIDRTFENKCHNSILFKRTIILIKSWCYYEGNLMGSNIGLMASYALEILVAYLFNNYLGNFTSEVDAFNKFFIMLNEIDWENEILHLYGTINSNIFTEGISSIQNNEQELFNEPFWYISQEIEKDNNFILDIKDNSNFIKKLDKIMKAGEKINNRFFQLKFMNIIDPMIYTNNLGKSINYHNFSKLKKVVQLIIQDLNLLSTIKSRNDPLLYMNFLLKLFKQTLSNHYLELFIEYLNKPKIVIESPLIDDSSIDSSNLAISQIKLTKEEIEKFNNLYLIKTKDKEEDSISFDSIHYENYEFVIIKEIYDKLIEDKREILTKFFALDESKSIEEKIEEIFKKFQLI